MKKILQLGCGMVGRAMALDLAPKYHITVIDKNINALESIKNVENITTLQTDIRDEKIIFDLCSNFDIVLSAVPGFMGFSTLKNIIEAGKNVVDISFFPEDAYQLDDIAKQNSVAAIVDCGVAPGMSNFIAGFHYCKMQIEDFECMVGGLPFIREYPFQYKAPFSPIDVIEEYTRPARIVINGKIVTKPALSDRELVFVENIGTLEAFNTDGLRSMLRNLNIPNMKEKTLRYPGHIDLILALKEAGFFNTNPIKTDSVEIIPIEFTSKILFNKWYLRPDEKEFTVMIIKIRGYEDNRKVEYQYNLFDVYDEINQISSMARTTGYTATAMINYMLEQGIEQKGILAPEILGQNKDVFDYVMNYLKERDVIYKKSMIAD